MRWLVASALATAALSFGPSARATHTPLVLQERDYDCKTIASSRDVGLESFAPKMNGWGQVAFSSLNQTTFAQEIRVGHGDDDGSGRPKTYIVADEIQVTGAIILLGQPVIDDSGSVVFSAFQQIAPGATAGGQGILRVPYFQRVDRSPNPIVENTSWDPPGAYDGDFGNVSTNSTHTLLFQLPDSHPNASLYVGTTAVAKEGTGGIVGLDDNDEVIDPGSDAFYGFFALLSNGNNGVFLDGTLRDSVSPTASIQLAGLSVNGHAVPVASYVRNQYNLPATWTIEAESDLGHQTLVDSTVDPFLSTDAPYATSLNVWGEVAFVSTAVDGGADASRLFVVRDSELWRVHCHDMQGTFGVPYFISYQISSRAINDNGQIAFLAETSDQSGTTVLIVRADPLPGQSGRPTSCSGLADGTPCDDGNPITISSCQAQICTGEPGAYPASCVGQEDNTPCQAADPKLIGVCANHECVGRSPAAPEPEAGPLGAGALAALVLLRAGREAKRRSLRPACGSDRDAGRL